MKRRRYIKLAMSRGETRNGAARIAELALPRYGSYANMYRCFYGQLYGSLEWMAAVNDLLKVWGSVQVGHQKGR